MLFAVCSSYVDILITTVYDKQCTYMYQYLFVYCISISKFLLFLEMSYEMLSYFILYDVKLSYIYIIIFFVYMVCFSLINMDTQIISSPYKYVFVIL